LTSVQAAYRFEASNHMLVSEAQSESRDVYIGGFVGQLVSAMIWFTSAAIATIVNPATGFWTLAIGGAAIFPLTKLMLHMSGRRTALARQNPLRNLAIQIAFTVPLVLPVAGIATLYHPGFFYPSCMVIVGAHYLPFVFLYGMKTYAGLAATLVAAGYAIGIVIPSRIVIGGWVGGAILVTFAFALLVAYKKGPTSQPVVRREFQHD
jgi:hypothetical protein